MHSGAKRRNGSTCVIRPMTEADVPAVAGLEAHIFSQPWSAQGFLDALALPGTVFLTAEEEGQIAGYIGMYLSVDEGEITNVAVAPLMRRRGVGWELLLEAKREAERRGIARIVLEVRTSNEGAIALYEKSGFSTVGIRKDFYECPKEDAYIMIYGQ